MPTGIWTLSGKPPARPGTTGPDYLPEGTRIRLLFGGPTEYAVEHGITNEVAVTVGLLGPVTPELCRTGLGRNTESGANICDADGQPLPSTGAAAVDFDEAIATLSRLRVGPDAPVLDGFFAGLGARPGDRRMSIGFKFKGFSWELWVKSADEMVSLAYIKGATRKDIESFPLSWKRT